MIKWAYYNIISNMTRNIYKSLLFSHLNLGISHFSYSLRHWAFHLFFLNFLNLNVDRCLFFFFCVVCSTSIYGLWLPLWCLQAFLSPWGQALVKKGIIFFKTYFMLCIYLSFFKGFHNTKMYLFCSFRYALKVHEYFMCVLSWFA